MSTSCHPAIYRGFTSTEKKKPRTIPRPESRYPVRTLRHPDPNFSPPTQQELAEYYAAIDTKRRGNRSPSSPQTGRAASDAQEGGGSISFFCMLLIAAIVYVTQMPTSPAPAAQSVHPPPTHTTTPKK